MCDRSVAYPIIRSDGDGAQQCQMTTFVIIIFFICTRVLWVLKHPSHFTRKRTSSGNKTDSKLTEKQRRKTAVLDPWSSPAEFWYKVCLFQFRDEVRENRFRASKRTIRVRTGLGPQNVQATSTPLPACVREISGHFTCQL
jgi:hypothetical protein